MSGGSASGPASLILPTVWVHGRHYGTHNPQKYLFPLDQEELNRMDLLHKFFLEARRGELMKFSSPPSAVEPLRILDLGTGTGIWAFHVAERLPTRPILVAVDLNRIQPPYIPQGVTTMQFDIEQQSWDPLPMQCDFIHLRLLFGSIATNSWSQIYENIFKHLRSNSGRLEQVEIDWTPRWEDNNIPIESAWNRWSHLLLQALEGFHRTAMVDSDQIRTRFLKSGFVDVEEEIVKCDVSPWSDDKHQKEVAKWFNLCLTKGLEAMSLMPMIDGLGMQQEEVKALCQAVKDELCTLRFRGYLQM